MLHEECEEGWDLFVSVGESESPSMINEKDIGVFSHRIRSQNEASHAILFARFDLEMLAAVEGFGGEFVEETAVEGFR